MDYSECHVKEQLQRSLAAEAWRHVPVRNHHGISLPLSALHSNQSCGIGEFLDLIPLIDWCCDVGMDNLQLLPLNDTGYGMSPYSALSAFAMHPIYLSMTQLPMINSYPGLIEQFSALQQLNGNQRVSFQQVLAMKEYLLQHYFSYVYDTISQQDDYCCFIKENPWVLGYSLFKVLKAKRNDTSWESWPEDSKNVSDSTEGIFNRLCVENQKEMNFYQFLQFLCFQQMKKVKQYATERGFFLQGDVPILISRDSADVWLHRSLFNLSFSAGAPPDVYSDEGQNWGFPIYEWKNHERDNYQWWRARLSSITPLFHLYRIDHIIGLFHIWAIPLSCSSKEGRYIPEEYDNWLSQGEKILQMMLKATILLPIGEDLGMVPPEVRQKLRRMGICGTKVMRWERLWDEDSCFIKPEDYIPESMTTVSTHDSEPLQLWWQRFPEDAKEYCRFKGWEYVPQLSKEYRYQILRDSHNSGSIFHINPLQEYLALFPNMIWPNPEDERINVPGTISDHNWSYRFRPSIEQLLLHEGLKKMVNACISEHK